MHDERVVEAIERLMIEAVGITTVALSDASPDMELSFPQWRALVVVGAREHGIRVGEIATRIGSTVPSTSRLVRRLERRGLVRAERDEVDRRATIVRLTPDGERLRGALIRRRRQLIRDALAVRPALARELDAGLDQIADSLSRYE